MVRYNVDSRVILLIQALVNAMIGDNEVMNTQSDSDVVPQIKLIARLNTKFVIHLTTKKLTYSECCG